MTELELEVRGADATWSLLALRFPHGAVLCGERRGQGTTQTFPEVDFDPARFDALAAALEHEAAVAGEAPGTLTMRRDGKELFARPCLADAAISALVQACCAADPEGVGPQVARALGIEAGAQIIPLPRDLITPEVAAGDLQTALRVGFESLRRDPAAARFAIGRIQLATGRPRAAERSFWSALIAQPAAIGLRAWIATARLQQGDAEGALDALKQDGELPDDTFAASARARSPRSGRLDDARAALEPALQQDGAEPGLRLLAARLSFDAGDVEGALSACRAVATDHPALPDPVMMQAELLAMSGDVAGADACLAAHLGLAAVEPRLAFLLAELRLRAGTGPGAPGEALFALLPVLAELSRGRADLLCELAALMGELGDGEGARLLLEDAVAVDPDAAEPRFRLALLAEAMGQPAAAAAAYREVLRLDPDHPGAAERLATLATEGVIDLGLGTGALWSDLAFAAVIASAFAVQGTIGFGAMLVAVGLGSQIVPLERLVPIGLLLSIPPNALLIARDHRHVDRRLLFGRVLPAMALGVPAGVWLLGAAPASAVRLGYGVFVAALALRALWQARGGRQHVGEPLGTPRALGLLGVGGVVHGMFSTGGPMVVTVVGRLGLDKRVFRATLLALWLSLGIWTAGSHAIAGRLDLGTAAIAVRLLPALAVGTWIGDKLHDRVDAVRFARWVQSLLLAAGISLIVRALGS